jgi:hypothetical protein
VNVAQPVAPRLAFAGVFLIGVAQFGQFRVAKSALSSTEILPSSASSLFSPVMTSGLISARLASLLDEGVDTGLRRS